MSYLLATLVRIDSVTKLLVLKHVLSEISILLLTHLGVAFLLNV